MTIPLLSSSSTLAVVAAGIHVSSVDTSDDTSGETIRIGTQASGVGDYDSNVSGAGPVWEDGTYSVGSGQVTVTGGVGSFNGSQTAGTHTCGNRTVEVDATYHACANQTEYAAIVSVAEGNLDGDTVVVRRAARLTNLATNSAYTAIYNADAHFTISGDGDGDYIWDSDSLSHFQEVSINRARGLKIEKCQFTSIRNHSSGATRIWFDQCHFGEDRPALDNPGAYSPGGDEPIWSEGDWHGLMITDCSMRGSGNTKHHLIRMQDWCIFVGNRIIAYKGDGPRFDDRSTSGKALWWHGFNTYGACLGSASNHADDFQLAGVDHLNGGSEANAHGPGAAADPNAEYSAMEYFDRTPSGGLTIRANAMCINEPSGYGLRGSSGNLSTSEMEYNSCIPTYAKTTKDWAADLDLNLGSSCITIDGNFGTIGSSFRDATNINIDGYTQAQMDTALPDHLATWSDIPTWNEIFARHKPATGEALAGLGAWSAIEDFPTDHRGSTATLKTSICPAPSPTSFSVSTSGSNFTGSVTTDVIAGFFKWAIIPNGQTFLAADWKLLLAGHIPNAYEYGIPEFARSTGSKTGWGGSVTLASGTYQVVAMHFNGWSRRSGVLSDTFTV